MIHVNQFRILVEFYISTHEIIKTKSISYHLKKYFWAMMPMHIHLLLKTMFEKKYLKHKFYVGGKSLL